jgi:hypothetical protein
VDRALHWTSVCDWRVVESEDIPMVEWRVGELVQLYPTVFRNPA